MNPLAPMASRPRLRAQRISSLREAVRVVQLILAVTFLPVAFGALFAIGWSQ